jgi:hypothetical protein
MSAETGLRQGGQSERWGLALQGMSPEESAFVKIEHNRVSRGGQFAGCNNNLELP